MKERATITKATIMELQQQGKTSQEIAEFLGCSVTYLESNGYIQEDDIQQEYQKQQEEQDIDYNYD